MLYERQTLKYSLSRVHLTCEQALPSLTLPPFSRPKLLLCTKYKSLTIKHGILCSKISCNAYPENLFEFLIFSEYIHHQFINR